MVSYTTLLIVVAVLLLAAVFFINLFAEHAAKVAKQKGYDQGLQDGIISKGNTVFKCGTIVHRGIDPCTGVEIFDSEHPADEFSVIPHFGINIKYNPNNERPAERFFQIHSECDYTTPVKQDIHITPNGVTDGWHTFEELYNYRAIYNAGLVNMIVWAKKHTVGSGGFSDVDAIKSKKHFDGKKCYDGNYFIVVIKTPFGQISNHYKMEHWDKFNCRATKTAWKYDGHTMQESNARLIKLYNYIANGRW